MPAIQTTGRREHWLQLDPRCMREWAMTPLALSLRLAPLDAEEAARVPVRARVEEVLQPDGQLPANHVYVGQGHHSHRLPLSIWASPFTAGHDCSEDDWFCLYVNHVCSQLWDQLPSLHGTTLVCDCPWQSLCEADLLAGLVFDALAPQRPAFVSQAGGISARPNRAAASILLPRQHWALRQAPSRRWYRLGGAKRLLSWPFGNFFRQSGLKALPSLWWRIWSINHL